MRKKYIFILILFSSISAKLYSQDNSKTIQDTVFVMVYDTIRVEEIIYDTVKVNVFDTIWVKIEDKPKIKRIIKPKPILSASFFFSPFYHKSNYSANNPQYESLANLRNISEKSSYSYKIGASINYEYKNLFLQIGTNFANVNSKFSNNNVLNPQYQTDK